MLGSWVRAPGGSPKEKPKGDKKKTSPTKSIFCGTFLLSFGYLDRHEKVAQFENLGELVKNTIFVA
jgi:hypothetical protein